MTPSDDTDNVIHIEQVSSKRIAKFLIAVKVTKATRADIFRPCTCAKEPPDDSNTS